MKACLRDMDFTSFVKYGENDLQPETPHLSISLHGPIELSLTPLPYPIRFIILRLAKNDATDSRPCFFRFDPSLDAFSPHGLVLLRHTWNRGRGGLQLVPVDHNQSAVGTPAGQEFEDNSQFIFELASPGDEVSLTATLPEQFYRAMGRDLHVFTLLFPGDDSVPWGWGTIQGGVVRRALKGENAGQMVVPGGARLNLKANYFSEYRTADWPWFQPATLAEPSERIPGAPYFTVTVKGSTSVKCYDRITVTLVFTYHGVTGTNGSLEVSTAPPVTFHSWALTSSRDFTFQVQRRRGAGSDWEDCQVLEDFSCCGPGPGRAYDEPDLEVSIGQQDEDFTSLRPGESWTETEWLNDWPDVSLPRDSMPGDQFRGRVKRSGVLDWWDWGTMEEHRETVVKLPCFVKGYVTEPKDIGGRPKLVVPASEWFEFTLIE
ncbi:hypothetical protein N657DRAFT_443593 [Parathielavia appendiculata]|uniref:Uncharacterized protein n=1 Tax=Parathielavia appendiculata TaxID=2587402 RepID=A0AAN6TYD9_9PEZI|nr:hypothetical protein N657DRAFT_443593 [Parathielavia appendiculata]